MKKYTYNFKQKVINDYHQGMTCKELCIKYSIEKSCLYDWLKFFEVKNNPKNGLYLSRLLKLMNQLIRVSRELEIIKQTHCFPDSSIKEKEVAI